MFFLFLHEVGFHQVQLIRMWLCFRDSWLFFCAISCRLLFCNVLIHRCFERSLTCLTFIALCPYFKDVSILAIFNGLQQFVKIVCKGGWYFGILLDFFDSLNGFLLRVLDRLAKVIYLALNTFDRDSDLVILVCYYVGFIFV